MKWFSLLLALTSLPLYAQAPGPTSDLASYYTDANKDAIVTKLQNRMMNGCTIPKEVALPVIAEELDYRVKNIKSLLEDKYSKSFAENPKIKEALFKDLDAINSDKSCQEAGNDCRTRLVATSIFYYQNLRPNIPGCKDYVKKEPMAKGYDSQCEVELKYRNQTLDTYGRSNGGQDQRGTYTDNLIHQLNYTTDKIFLDVLHRTKVSPTKKQAEVKDMVNLNICENVQSGQAFVYPLKMNLYKDPISQAEPNKPVPVKVEPCVEEVTSLYSEFVPLNFDEGRSTVGGDQIDPVKQKILDFIAANPNMIITEVSVSSNSSKTPYYKEVGGKKVIDPASDERNKKLAAERAAFAEKALTELKSSNSTLEKVELKVTSGLAGPDFDPLDLNNRFVTKQSPDYEKKVLELYTKNKEILERDAFIKDPKELMNESRFGNLYQAKYKPFQGFKINISGYKKETMKCGEIKDDKGNNKKGGSPVKVKEGG